HLPRDERTQGRFHLLARGDVEAAIHEQGHQRAMIRLLAEQRVVVVPLVLARATLDRRLRLRPADQPLEHRKATEHPGGLVVTGENGDAADSRAREGIRHLWTARAAADHDDVTRPRWVRAVRRLHSFAERRRWASALSIRSITCGWSSRNC